MRYGYHLAKDVSNLNPSLTTTIKLRIMHFFAQQLSYIRLSISYCGPQKMHCWQRTHCADHQKCIQQQSNCASGTFTLSSCSTSCGCASHILRCHHTLHHQRCSTHISNILCISKDASDQIAQCSAVRCWHSTSLIVHHQRWIFSPAQTLTLYITKCAFFSTFLIVHHQRYIFSPAQQLNSSHCTSPNAHFSQHLLLYMTKGAFFVQLNSSHCKLEEVHFLLNLSNTGLTCHSKSRGFIWSYCALLKWKKTHLMPVLHLSNVFFLRSNCACTTTPLMYIIKVCASCSLW